MMAGPVQHFRSAILEAWRFHVFAKLSERKGFWRGEFADFQGSLQLLTSSHLRERDNMLLRAILCGRVWNGFLLGKARKEDVPCRFCCKIVLLALCLWNRAKVWTCHLGPSFNLLPRCTVSTMPLFDGIVL